MINSNTKSNKLLTIIFGCLVVIQIGYLLLGLASYISFYQRVTTQTVTLVKLPGFTMSNEVMLQAAAQRHLSLEAYAIFRILFDSICALIPMVVALLILRRLPRQWYAWFTASMLLYMGQSALAVEFTASGLVPFKIVGINDIFWFLLLLFILLFPNGQAVPRRLGWVSISLVVYHFFVQAGTVIGYFAPDFASRYPLPSWGNPIFVIPVIVNLVLILICQVYRYRKISTPVERQQTKWFVFGLAAIIALIPISNVGHVGYLEDISGRAISLSLVIAVGFSILRYKLWDIDIIIRRTLVYGALTLSLALVYFGSVIIFQKVFNLITGGAGQSTLGIVLSTLAIAALFNPLRKRIQEGINRRFYRTRYEADRTMEQFADILRNEVNINQLCAGLLGVVQETMQPEHDSLWIRAEGRK